MISPREMARHLGPLFLLATTWSTLSSSLAIDLCASINTGETPKNISIYQTNGLCHDFCVQDYAFAITQKNACWCSNIAPAKSEQEDLSKCDFPCPAYPEEDCGSEKNNLFGYVSLENVLPSGTQGASTSSETEESSTEAPTSTTTSFTTTSEKPSSIIQTVTADGTIRTVTIGPTRTGTTEHDSTPISVKSKGLSTGQVVGIVVGIIAAVIIAAGLCLFFWFRRKKQQRNEQDFQDDPSIRDSSSGMVAGSRPDMAMSGSSPVSAPAAMVSRNSTLQVDPRMDPFKQGLYMRSVSHESVNTIRDDHDYSRRILRATNPDPTPGH